MNADDQIGRVLISEEEISTRLAQLASEITTATSHQPLVVVAVLKGALVMVADLVRRLPVPLDLEFITAQSYYGGTQSSGEVLVQGELPDIQGKTVLLVDDILDTGLTLQKLREMVNKAGAKQVLTCVLLNKRKVRSAEVTADFSGFEIEDEFVVGYGLDYAGRYRNLPYIGVLNAPT